LPDEFVKTLPKNVAQPFFVKRIYILRKNSTKILDISVIFQKLPKENKNCSKKTFSGWAKIRPIWSPMLRRLDGL
jgi:hypothetical protein